MTLHNARDLFSRPAAAYQWVAVPGPLPLEHYDEVLHALADRSRAVPGVIGMFDLGPVRYPGLSDLDVVFVIDDRFSDFAALRPLLRAAQPAEFHDVLLHDPYFIRRSDLEVFFHFAPIFQYRAVWAGAGLPHEGVISDPLDLLLFLMDIIAESYPREFIAPLLAPVLDERTLLSRLKGLAYCFDLFTRLSGRPEPEFEAYTRSINALREDYLDLPSPDRPRRLLPLTHDAVRLSQRLALLTSRHLEENGALHLAGRLDLWCAGTPAIFTAAAGPDPRYGAVRLRRTEVFAEVPAAFGWLVSEYARIEGPFSARLRERQTDRLRLAAPPSTRLAEAIRRRAVLRNAHTAWADATGLGLSTFLTFGYRSRRRLAGLPAAREAAGRLAEHAREHLLRRRMSNS